MNRDDASRQAANTIGFSPPADPPDAHTVACRDSMLLRNYPLPRVAAFAIFHTMSITATVENDMIKLPPNVHLPDGTKVRLEPIAPTGPGKCWPAGYFARTAGMVAGERLERPEQGTAEQREEW